jgi:hypothetical protein
MILAGFAVTKPADEKGDMETTPIPHFRFTRLDAFQLPGNIIRVSTALSVVGLT